MRMKRGSGILLHISSLPSDYGTGDLGPQAYKFIDFLERCRQSYWQILPFTPTEMGQSNSPYSGPSAFAGNSLFISPDMLCKQRLLSRSDLKTGGALSRGRVDFKKATFLKQKLLHRAYKNFKKERTNHLAFNRFCKENADWLNDYVLYKSLKDKFQNKPWNQWPQELKNRDQAALEVVRHEYRLSIEEEKFIQFIFADQWMRLKKYCQKAGIQIIGDIPIYVSFDSVEVWANPGYFKLDDQLADPIDFRIKGARRLRRLPLLSRRSAEKNQF